MKTVVVTGSTRGIGLGLAGSFLALGCQVVVSGRTQAAVDQAVRQLAAKHPAERILGQACDMTVFEQVQALWDAAAARFGRVDIWINNAGLSNSMMPLWEVPPQRLHDVVHINVVGKMYGAKAAISGMLRQGGGHVYNMEGFGSDGGVRAGLTPYGLSKYAVRYLNKALLAETKGTSVKVSRISPGIVITDLLMDGYVGSKENAARAKRIFNILGDKVETVTPYLARKILENESSGAYIRWLTFPKIVFRFLTAGINKRDLFNEPAGAH